MQACKLLLSAIGIRFQISNSSDWYCDGAGHELKSGQGGAGDGGDGTSNTENKEGSI